MLHAGCRSSLHNYRAEVYARNPQDEIADGSAAGGYARWNRAQVLRADPDDGWRTLLPRAYAARLRWRENREYSVNPVFFWGDLSPASCLSSAIRRDDWRRKMATTEPLTEREQQALEHMRKAQELGTTLVVHQIGGEPQRM
jgi:hypothetical protein